MDALRSLAVVDIAPHSLSNELDNRVDTEGRLRLVLAETSLALSHTISRLSSLLCIGSVSFVLATCFQITPLRTTFLLNRFLWHHLPSDHDPADHIRSNRLLSHHLPSATPPGLSPFPITFRQYRSITLSVTHPTTLFTLARRHHSPIATFGSIPIHKSSPFPPFHLLFTAPPILRVSLG